MTKKEANKVGAGTVGHPVDKNLVLYLDKLPEERVVVGGGVSHPFQPSSSLECWSLQQSDRFAEGSSYAARIK